MSMEVQFFFDGLSHKSERNLRYPDPRFIKTFLMTYKSFTTLDEFFELLVQRFFIQPPDGLNSRELDEWRKLKQHVIQMRFVQSFLY